jgi:hypothetical protein
MAAQRTLVGMREAPPPRFCTIEAMIRPATAADAEAIYELLYAARDEIPLRRIAAEPREVWLDDRIPKWCAYDRSLVAELDGEVVSVIIVVPRMHSTTGDGVVLLSEWELLYATTREDYRGKILFEGKRLFDALLDKAVEPFETVYAEVAPATRRRWPRGCPCVVSRRRPGLRMGLSSLS